MVSCDPNGGLDLGQVYYVASQITDGDGWMKAFTAYGNAMDARADERLRKTWHHETGEARMILGAGDSQVFAQQAQAWHEQLRSTKKSFVLLYAASGADGHVQVNNRLRLCQECVGWMGQIFDRSQA